MGVQLRIPFPAGAVHERRRRHARRDPLAFAVDLLAGGTRPPLQELEGDRHGLHVGDRRHRRHLGLANAHSTETDFGAENVTSNAATRPFPVPAQQLVVGGRVPAQQQRPQLVGLDHPCQAELGPPAGPATPRALRRRPCSSRRSLARPGRSGTRRRPAS